MNDDYATRGSLIVVILNNHWRFSISIHDSPSDDCAIYDWQTENQNATRGFLIYVTRI